MWADRRQLARQRARPTAELAVVLVGAELSFHHQMAVGEERVVRTDRIYVDS